MKTCSCCKNIKALSEFNKNAAQKDGLDNQCTVCSRASKSRWKKQNRDKCNAQQKRAYYKDLKKEATRKRLWRKAHRAQETASSQRRNTAKLQRTPEWLTKSDWIEISWAYKISDQRTKETGIQHEVDHIIPLRGENVSGLHVPWNLQILTKSENARKKNRMIA